MKRTSKKMIYGVFYIALLGFLGMGIYNGIFASAPTCFDGKLNQHETGVDCGGECKPCYLKNLESIKTMGSPEIFSLDSGRAVILSKIVNPNSAQDAASFSYTLNIYNSSGDIIEKAYGADSLPASRTKYIVESGIRAPLYDITRVDMTFSNITWNPRGASLQENLTVSRIVTTLEGSQIAISGEVKNESAISLRDIKLVGILFNTFGQKIFASQTLVSTLGSFKSIPFVMRIPRDSHTESNVDLAATQVFAY